MTNDAVEVLDEKTSARIRAELRSKREDCKILTPRWVFTDKNDGLRTKENNLGIKASARLVVPGFRDVLSFSLRKDAPTASRLSQHLVFTFTASNFQKLEWRLMSCDVKSAFLEVILTWTAPVSFSSRTPRVCTVNLNFLLAPVAWRV